MNSFDSEYSLIFRTSERDDAIFLVSDERTANTNYGVGRLNPGRPLIFENAYAEEYGDESEFIADLMFEGSSNIVVNEQIKTYLENFEINGLQIYPAVYKDMLGKLHENLWFLNFYLHLKCWDRENSAFYGEEDENEDDADDEYNDDADDEYEDEGDDEYEDEGDDEYEDDDDIKPAIKKLSLDADLLANIPEDHRLLIRIDGLDIGYVLVHKRIVRYLERIKATGYRVIPISKYVGGMENFDE